MDDTKSNGHDTCRGIRSENGPITCPIPLHFLCKGVLATNSELQSECGNLLSKMRFKMHEGKIRFES